VGYKGQVFLWLSSGRKRGGKRQPAALERGEEAGGDCSASEVGRHKSSIHHINFA
jgi:hypothetical protein